MLLLQVQLPVGFLSDLLWAKTGADTVDTLHKVTVAAEESAGSLHDTNLDLQWDTWKMNEPWQL